MISIKKKSHIVPGFTLYFPPAHLIQSPPSEPVQPELQTQSVRDWLAVDGVLDSTGQSSHGRVPVAFLYFPVIVEVQTWSVYQTMILILRRVRSLANIVNESNVDVKVI